MPDNSIPPPPPGFIPLSQANKPTPPPGFVPESEIDTSLRPTVENAYKQKTRLQSLRDEADDAGIARRLGIPFDKIKNAYGYVPGMLKYQVSMGSPEAIDFIKSKGVLDRIANFATNPIGSAINEIRGNPQIDNNDKSVLNKLISLGHGTFSTAAGAQQKLAHLLGAKDSAALSDATLKIQKLVYDELNPGGGGITDIPYTAGTIAAIPNVGASAPAAKGILSGLLKGAASGALYGAAAPDYDVRYNDQGQSSILSDTLSQAAGGAAIGGAIGGVTPVAIKAGGKLLDKLAGTKLGKKLGIKTQIKPEYQGVRELANELEKRGITNYTIGDLTGNPQIRNVEDRLAKINDKMINYRLEGNKQAANAAKFELNKLAKDLENTGLEGINELQNIASSDSPRAKSAKSLLEQMQQTGKDPEDILKSSLDLKSFLTKNKADQLYNIRDSLIPDGIKPNVTGTINEIDKSIKSMSLDQFRDHAGEIKILRDFQNKLKSGNLDYKQLSATRSSLGEEISRYYKGNNAVTGSVGANFLQPIKDQLSNDLSNFAQNSGNEALAQADTAARKFYANYKKTYQDSRILAAMRSTEPDVIAKGFEAAGPDRAQKLFDALEPKGQAAWRLNVVQRALEGANQESRGVQGIDFSIPQAVRNLEKLTNRGVDGVVFPGGPEKWSALGLIKVLKTIDRASSVAANPQTGQLSEGPLAIAKSGTHFLSKLIDKEITGDYLFKLHTDKNSRLLLQRASSLKIGSKELNDIVNKIVNRAPQVGAYKAGEKAKENVNLIEDEENP